MNWLTAFIKFIESSFRFEEGVGYKEENEGFIPTINLGEKDGTEKMVHQ